MVRKATLGMFLTLLVLVCLGTSITAANAQTATPSQAVITVSGVPTGTTGLAVSVTVDTGVVTLGSASTSVSGGLAVTGSMSEGVGILSTSGDLPASFTITVPLTGVAAGTSMVAVGSVLDKIGGTEIAGATASVDVSSVTVASSSTSSTSTTSSSSSSTGGTGMLSADTVTITINGQALSATNAVNVTLAFGTNGVATVDTASPTFMGTGASQLLTSINGNVVTAVWDGAVTDNQVVLTAMLKAGSVSGSTTVSVSKVEVAGGTDVTDSVAATVNPPTVTNSGSGGSSTSSGSFVLLGPTTVTGPGKAAIAFSASGLKKGSVVKLNGMTVKLFDNNSVGIGIVKFTGAGSVPLTLKVGKSEVNLGTLTVTAGSGTAPKVKSASARNSSSLTKLKVKGSNLSGATVTIVPTDRSATSTDATDKVINAEYSSDECIPNGSFVNVTTTGGTSAKRVSTKGSCSNSLN